MKDLGLIPTTTGVGEGPRRTSTSKLVLIWITEWIMIENKWTVLGMSGTVEEASLYLHCWNLRRRVGVQLKKTFEEMTETSYIFKKLSKFLTSQTQRNSFPDNCKYFTKNKRQ